MRKLKRKGESWIDRDLDLDRLNSRDIIRGEPLFLVDFFFFISRANATYLPTCCLKVLKSFFFPRGDRYILSALIDGILNSWTLTTYV